MLSTIQTNKVPSPPGEMPASQDRKKVRFHKSILKTCLMIFYRSSTKHLNPISLAMST